MTGLSAGDKDNLTDRASMDGVNLNLVFKDAVKNLPDQFKGSLIQDLSRPSHGFQFMVDGTQIKDIRRFNGSDKIADQLIYSVCSKSPEGKMVAENQACIRYAVDLPHKGFRQETGFARIRGGFQYSNLLCL